MPGFWDYIIGSDSKIKQQRRYSKPVTSELENLQLGQGGIQESPLYQAGSDWLMKLLSGDTSVFEQPLMQQFNEQIVPQIAERFGGMGAGSSSGLNQTLAQAGSTLSQQIAAIRGGLMNQASGQALQYAQQPYANQLTALGMSPYENIQIPGMEGFIPTFLNAAAEEGGKQIFKGGGNAAQASQVAAAAG